jgi:exosortase
VRFHLLWISAFVLVFAPTMRWLWERWTMSIWHNLHGMFVPVLVAMFAWRTLRRRDEAGQPSPLGFLFVVPATILVIADCALRTGLLSAIALVLSLPGLSLLLFGIAATKALTFPLALSVVMLPVPTAAIEDLQAALMAVSALGAEHVIRLLGFTLYREGTTLFLPTGSLLIGNACSGFSTLYASLSMGAVLAYYAPSPQRRVMVVAAAVICPIAANILRCAVLALAVSNRGLNVLDTPLHEASGILAFALVGVTLVRLAGLNRSRSVDG